MNSDYRDLFCALNAREVRYLVVGAHAVTFHARPRFTKDLDVRIECTPDNARRAWRALTSFGAPVGDLDAAELARPGVVLQIGVAPNRIDIMTRVDGVEFAPAWERRCATKYGDAAIHVLSRQDLVANKRARGRPQDLLDLEALGETRAG